MDSKEIKQLEKEYLQVKETLKLKDELLAAITHELRTSLSLIKGPLSKLEEIDLDEKQTLNAVKKNLTQLNKITDQLGDVSRLQTYQNNLQVSEIEVGSFLKRYVAFFESRANQKEITLQVNLPEQPVVQTVDSEKLEKTIIILLTNALRFTSSKGKVEVTLKDENDRIRIAIKDTGCGMSASEIKRLFNNYSEDWSVNHNFTDPVGIRLSIAKKYIEMHDGKMNFDSEKGRGTTVELILPKEADCLEHAVEKEAELQGEDIICPEVNSMQDLPPMYGNYGAETTILVIEDDRDIRDYIAILLRKIGINIEVASNGAEGLKQLAMIQPDLIISDIMMPEMDGFEFVKNLRGNSKYHLTPVIFISAKTEEEARIRGYQIGISDYLVKPFSEPELKARIQNLLRQRKERERYHNESEGQVNYEESLIENLKNYVHDHIQNGNITSNELGEKVNLSRRQLYRELKSLTGFTPAEFVREVKLRKARELLENNRKITVAEIARQVGYNTTSHFSKIFRNRFGRNPSKC